MDPDWGDAFLMEKWWMFQPAILGHNQEGTLVNLRLAKGHSLRFASVVSLSHRIQMWYIYPHLVDFYGFHVGKYIYQSHGSVVDMFLHLFMGEKLKKSGVFSLAGQRVRQLGFR